MFHCLCFIRWLAQSNGKRNNDCGPGAVHLPVSRVFRSATNSICDKCCVMAIWAYAFDSELGVHINVDHHSFQNARPQKALYILNCA